jgi:hypothetical protein
LSSGTGASATSCQNNNTEPLTSEADYSCSHEGEEAYSQSDAEESTRNDSNEALKCKLHYRLYS